jgi:secretory carrier-associated membrane protein
VQNGGGGARGGGVKPQYGFRPTEPAGFGGGRGDATTDIPLDTMNVREAPPPSLYYPLLA